MFNRPDSRRAVQAAGVLLRFANGRMDYMRLLKLLYIADRESVRQTGVPVVGGRTVAMNRGPLHSVVYNWVKPEDTTRWFTGPADHEGQQLWTKFIGTHLDKSAGIYDVELIGDPGDGALSDCQVALLNAVSEEHVGRHTLDIVEETHEFPEFRKCFEQDTSRPIPWEAILEAVGRKDQIRALAAHEAAVNAFRETVGV